MGSEGTSDSKRNLLKLFMDENPQHKFKTSLLLKAKQ